MSVSLEHANGCDISDPERDLLFINTAYSPAPIRPSSLIHVRVITAGVHWASDLNKEENSGSTQRRDAPVALRSGKRGLRRRNLGRGCSSSPVSLNRFTFPCENIAWLIFPHTRLALQSFPLPYVAGNDGHTLALGDRVASQTLTTICCEVICMQSSSTRWSLASVFHSFICCFSSVWLPATKHPHDHHHQHDESGVTDKHRGTEPCDESHATFLFKRVPDCFILLIQQQFTNSYKVLTYLRAAIKSGSNDVQNVKWHIIRHPFHRRPDVA